MSLPAETSIDDYELEAVNQFAYLGSTITDNLSLDGRGAQQTYWKGRNYACPPHYTRLGEPQALYEDKDSSE